MLTKKQFTKEINKVLEEKSILKHPFYQKWNEGKLSLDELKIYAKEYFHFVKNFPMFVSSVHSYCNDSETRRMLVENIADEDGFKSNVSDHPTLWMNFCKALGLPEQEVLNHHPSNAAKEMVDGFYKLTRTNDYRVGLAGLLGYEKQIPEVSRVKIYGLKKFYSISDEKAIEFFTVHEEADILHSKAELDALLNSCSDEQSQKTVLKTVEDSAMLYWKMLDHVYVN